MNRIFKGKEKISDAEKTKRKLKRLLGMTSLANVSAREKIELCGCRGITLYRPDQICVRLCDGKVTVNGHDLRISDFFGGRMIICGRIDCISFSDR